MHILEELKSIAASENKWFHYWEGSSVQRAEGDEGDKYIYTEFSTCAGSEWVKRVIYEMRVEGYGRMCSHTYDCCGCSFLNFVSVYEDTNKHNAYSNAPRGVVRYLVVERWSINV